MSVNKPEEMRSYICSVFIRKGGDGYHISLFENLEDEKKREIVSKMELGKMEIPVIGGILASNHWILLTTDRLIWRSGIAERSVKIDDIRDASVNFLEMKRRGQTKDKMNHLVLKTFSGDEHAIEIEAGPPLSGMWNVLKNLGMKNRRKSNE